MRVIAAIGVVVLLVGLGLAGRYLVGDDTLPIDSTHVTLPSTNGGTASTNAAGDSNNDTASAPAPIPPLPGPENDADQSEPEANDTISTAPSVSQDTADTNLPPVASEDGPFRLSLPLSCTIGVDCYILNYVNVGSENEPRDYTCGPLTYGEHRGTDFRLIDYVQMEEGVNVVAAAPGVVTAIRDGMPDANFKLFGRDAVNARGRGNVVIIRHDNGVSTGYSHLRRGSVAVSIGDRVTRGQMLGMVGLSGLTEFPHVHFEVMQNGIFLDPFSGVARHEGCGIEVQSMWRDELVPLLRYPRTLVMRYGFANQVLNRAAVEYALFNQDPIPTDSTALVFHVYLAGVQPGDGFVAEITAPDGARFVKSGREFKGFFQNRLLAVGKQDMVTPLEPGTYNGTFRFFRKDADGANSEIITITDSVTVQ